MRMSLSQGGGYMFEFDNVGNRDLCRDFVGNVHFVVCECLQQQQHSLFSQASWGRLEMKPGRNKFKV